jgi:hypothetical protein
MRSDDGIEVSFAGMHVADGAQQVFAHHAFQYVSACARLHRAVDLFLAGMGGKHQDTGVRKVPQQGRGRLRTVHSGQANIHDDEVRTVRLVGIQRGLPVSDLGDNIHVGLRA